MKKIILSVALVGVIAFLVWWLVGLFQTPMQFEEMRLARENKVVERLKDIRTAQRAFRTKYGRFVSTMDSLITFVKTDSLELILAIGNEDDSLAKATKQVIRKKTMIAVKDTIFNARLRKDPSFTIEEIRFIPGSEKATGSKKEFRFGSKMIVTESKVNVPVFEAFAPYIEFLGDLDKQELINYRDERVNTLKKEDGLKVGSLESPNNEAGNWE